MMKHTLYASLLLTHLFSANVYAEVVAMQIAEPPQEKPVSHAEKYTGPTVAERMTMMDTDKNGFVDARELRDFVEKTQGRDDASQALDRLAASVNIESCNSPFTQKLYTLK